MRELISFHPVDPGFFDNLIGPLTAGEKVNPEAFLEDGDRVMRISWVVHSYRLAIEMLQEELRPPALPDSGTMWEKMRARLERLDHRPPELARLIDEKIDPNLHLTGRPFLITDKSSDAAADLAGEYVRSHNLDTVRSLVIDQLMNLDLRLGRELQPEDIGEPQPKMIYRNTLLAGLRRVYDMAKAVRDGRSVGLAGGPSPVEMLVRRLPHQAIETHSRVAPFWLAQDVDGLVTVCRAANIEPPACIVPAARLFREACRQCPALEDRLDVEMHDSGDVGAFVPPEGVTELLQFLEANGAGLIRMAARYGEGPACTTLLHKIRECARYAEKNGCGYLEASAIRPIIEEPEDSLMAAGAPA